MSNWGFKEATPILWQYEQHGMKKKSKSKLSFAYFGWSGSLKKACSETLDKVHNISPQFSICCVCFDVTLYTQMKIGQREVSQLTVYRDFDKCNEFHARRFSSDVLCDKINIT